MSDSCYVYLLKATRLEMLTEGPTDEEAVVISDHLDYLARLAEEGTVILAGRTQTNDASTFGIVIFEANGDRADQVVANDPAVQHGVMSATLYPYRIAVQGKGSR